MLEEILVSQLLHALGSFATKTDSLACGKDDCSSHRINIASP